MIIGHGLIASAFMSSYLESDPSILIFASGVSNSREVRSEAFAREREMLVEALASGMYICYFSTCSVNDPELQDSLYVVHKKEMEELVRSAKDYAIFRLPQVVGRTLNPNTLTNYIYSKIISGESFHVWQHAKRNLIDVDDVVSIVNYLVRTFLAHKSTVNIASPFPISIPSLVKVLELVLGKKAQYSLIDAGGTYSIDIGLVNEVASQAGVNFDETYIEKLIRKYYGK